jgi:hypothetical protein
MTRVPLVALACAACLTASACAGGAAPPSSEPAAASVGASSGAASPTVTARPRATLPPPPTPLSAALKVQRTKPEGLLSADGSIWVAESASGTVVRLDPATGKAQATITGLPDGLLYPFGGAGRVWVPSAHGLVAIDPSRNRVVLTVKGSFSMAGTVAGGHVWIGDGRDRLLELDASTGATLHTLSIGGPGENVGETCSNAVASVGGAIWWSVNDAGVIVRVDPSSAQATAQIKNVGSTFVTAVSGIPWAVSNAGSVLAIDPAAGSVSSSTTFGLALSDVCAGPIVADGSTLWFLDGRSSCGCGTGSSPLYRFDTASRAGSGTFDPGDTGTQAIAIVNHAIWLAFPASGVVARYDPPFP